MTISSPPALSELPPADARTLPDDDRVIRVLGSRRAALAFAGIVFATTAVQVLSNPAISLLEGTAVWTHPLPLVVVLVLVAATIAAQASALLLSARRPRLAVVIATLCYVVLAAGVGVPTWLGAMQFVVAVSLFLLSAQVPWRTAAGWLAASAVAAVGGLLTWGLTTGAPAAAVTGFVVDQGTSFLAPAAGASALGLWWGVTSRRVARARAEAAAATREQKERLARARAQERARIAQELHDVSAQHIAGLLSLADAALDIEVHDVAQALSLVEDIRTEGRFASASLYAALRDLRAVDGERIERTPDLRDATELYAYWRQRGTVVEAQTLGDIDELPAVVSTSAYRGVQEALTNAAKHAPGARVRVDTVVDGPWLLVSVVNGPPPVTPAAAERPGLGWGLDGLHERVRLLRGSVEAGRTADGGWRVRLQIPIVEVDGPSDRGA